MALDPRSRALPPAAHFSHCHPRPPNLTTRTKRGWEIADSAGYPLVKVHSGHNVSHAEATRVTYASVVAKMPESGNRKAHQLCEQIASTRRIDVPYAPLHQPVSPPYRCLGLGISWFVAYSGFGCNRHVRRRCCRAWRASTVSFGISSFFRIAGFPSGSEEEAGEFLTKTDDRRYWLACCSSPWWSEVLGSRKFEKPRMSHQDDTPPSLTQSVPIRAATSIYPIITCFMLGDVAIVTRYAGRAPALDNGVMLHC